MFKRLLLLISIIIWGWFYIDAREYRVATSHKFHDMINRQELAIVMFYQESKAQSHRDRESEKELSKKIKYLKENFHDASKQERFVAFISVNVDKDDLGDITQRYNIQQFPTFMLFRNGKPFRAGAQKQFVKRTGYIQTYSMIDLVENNFGHFIDEILEAKRREAERRAEQARINALYWGPYWGWGWGWGYPYSGYYGYYW